MNKYNEVQPKRLGKKGGQKKEPAENGTQPAPTTIKWPESLQTFVIQCYQRGNVMFQENEAKQVQLNDQLQKLVDKAFSANLINENDWSRQKIPVLDNTPAIELECVLRAQAGLISGKHLKRKKTEKSVKEEPKVTPKETEGPVDYTLLKEKRGNDFNSNERKKQRLQRFESPKPQTSLDPVENSNVIVGRCQDLEKHYLRLTAAPDPAKVRPQSVLTKSVSYVLAKYRENKAYSYLINQFKSIRQDLTVQHIKNDFTIDVYETNAKLSIENNDLGEFNQCQSQLKYLYYLKRKNNEYLHNQFFGCEAEFVAYRIIYMIMTNNYSEIYKMKMKILTSYSTFIKTDSETILFEFVDSLFKLHQDIVVGNYHDFFRLLHSYKERAELALALQLFNNFIVHKNRVRALATISRSYRRLPVDFIVNELYFDNRDQFMNFLDKYKLTSFLSGSDFDCAGSKPVLTGIITKPNFNKVDIKGQI